MYGMQASQTIEYTNGPIFGICQTEKAISFRDASWGEKVAATLEQEDQRCKTGNRRYRYCGFWTFPGMWTIIAIIIAMQKGDIMKTVQMTLDEDLVKAVDRAAKRLGTTRSGFAREALRSALRKVHITELERKHREGYRRKPVKRGEFSDWESEQAWVE